MRLFGHSKTRQMMLTGLRLDGAELYRLGVVEDCVPVSDLMDVAMALAGNCREEPARRRTCETRPECH